MTHLSRKRAELAKAVEKSQRKLKQTVAQFLEDLIAAEIAEKHEISIGNAEVRISRGKAPLRDAMEH